MQELNIKIVGTGELLMNNPQSADPLNRYAKKIAPLSSKRGKTDEDHNELKNLRLESSIYLTEALGVFIPTSWVTAALAKNSHGVAKIAKAKIRAGVYADVQKVKLNFKGMNKIKTKQDIIKNPEFHNTMLMTQGQVKIPKTKPIFTDWSFQLKLMFDPTIVNESELKNILEYCCRYGGFGDFRPTFGRAVLEILA